MTTDRYTDPAVTAAEDASARETLGREVWEVSAVKTVLTEEMVDATGLRDEFLRAEFKERFAKAIAAAPSSPAVGDVRCLDTECDKDREAKMVVVARNPEGVPTVWCDPCIVPIVKALNDAGIATRASCCGHRHRPGHIMLRDGRELIIARDVTEAELINQQINRLFPKDINGEIRAAPQISDAELRAVALLRRYMMAVRSLGKVVDGRTLFEHSPRERQDCFDAWIELNNAGRAALAFLVGLGLPDAETLRQMIESADDTECEAGS